MSYSTDTHVVQKTRESFGESPKSSKEGKPEMQMKELVKYVVNQLFKYNYFHGFVTQELRHTEHLKDDLLEFYTTFTNKIDDVIKKGVATGVFTNAPKTRRCTDLDRRIFTFCHPKQKFLRIIRFG